MVLIMNVIVMDRGTLQKYLYGNFPYQDTAVVSFYGDDEKDVNFSVNPKVQYVKVRVNDEKNITEDQREWYRCELSKVVMNIDTWETRGEVHTIICQCDAGVSRSAGCAAAIRQYYHGDGIKYFANEIYSPNINVYNGVFNRLTQKWSH